MILAYLLGFGSGIIFAFAAAHVYVTLRDTRPDVSEAHRRDREKTDR